MTLPDTLLIQDPAAFLNLSAIFSPSVDTGSNNKVSVINLVKSIFKSFAKIVLITPKAARRTPRGSEDPVGFLPSANTAQIVSILSAIPTICPSVVTAISPSALRGK